MIARLRIIALALLAWTAPAFADDPPIPNKPAGVAAILEAHDRALVRDLADYVKKNPRADDLDQAYLTLFEKAIEHDWFADHEAMARSYLVDHPQGGVRPLAQIIATMARAEAGRFAEALTTYKDLIAGLDQADQEEFASNFADSLATAANAAGEEAIARQVYELLLAKFDNPKLKEKVADDLARIDRVGQAAPVVVARDLNGKTFRLSDLTGKYVLVDFWATWCAPCIAELPNLRAVYAKYHNRGFEIVGVSLDETAEPLADFVKARQVPWVQIHNATAGADVVASFGVNSIPACFLIGPDGKIVRLELRGPALEKALSQLIK
jgi:peroxiredoxin